MGELRRKLEASEEREKEAKVLLQVFQSSSKDNREIYEIRVSEQQLRAKNEVCRPNFPRFGLGVDEDLY